MSRLCNCNDKTVRERFYHTLKIELLYGEPLYNRDKAKLLIFDYIEVFYNRQRLHSSLDYQTPEAFALVAKVGVRNFEARSGFRKKCG